MSGARERSARDAEKDLAVLNEQNPGPWECGACELRAMADYWIRQALLMKKIIELADEIVMPDSAMKKLGSSVRELYPSGVRPDDN